MELLRPCQAKERANFTASWLAPPAFNPPAEPAALSQRTESRLFSAQTDQGSPRASLEGPNPWAFRNLIPVRRTQGTLLGYNGFAVPYQLSFSAIGEDGLAKISITGTLSEEDFRVLALYLEDADRLLRNRTAREGVPASLEIKVEAGQVVHVASEYPNADELYALLHCLRPFVLRNEPASFDNVCAAVVRALPHPYIRGYIHELRRQYFGTDAQQGVRITSNDVSINCERTLQDWLNGFEYHRDLEKRERIQSLHRLMSLQSSMPIFMGLLGEKVTAIFRLADLVGVLLGRQNDVQVQRRRRIDGVDP